MADDGDGTRAAKRARSQLEELLHEDALGDSMETAAKLAKVAAELAATATEISRRELPKQEEATAKAFVARCKAAVPDPNKTHDMSISVRGIETLRCCDCGRKTPKDERVFRPIRYNSGPWHTLCRSCFALR